MFTVGLSSTFFLNKAPKLNHGIELPKTPILKDIDLSKLDKESLRKLKEKILEEIRKK